MFIKSAGKFGLVCSGLTSHSVLFQLYRDGRPGARHPRHWQLGVFYLPNLSRHGPGML